MDGVKCSVYGGFLNDENQRLKRRHREIISTDDQNQLNIASQSSSLSEIDELYPIMNILWDAVFKCNQLYKQNIVVNQKKNFLTSEN